MGETISYKFSEFTYNLRLKDIPEEVVSRAKLHVLDTLGIMMATYNLEDVKRVVNVIRLLGGSPESTVVGYGFKVSALNAVIANAVMAHSVDYDDTHLGSGIHQSCTAIPTALAVGEITNASGREFLEAVIAAYEVNSRLGLVAPWLFHIRGIHPTSAIGVFGSALIAGRLMKLSIEQLAWALGIAGSLSSGILQCIPEGVWVKPMHPGFASHAGILAALLAREGCRGPLQVFEGRQGLFNAYLKGDKFDLKQATEGLGEKWETLNISIKPYPTCHATHSSIDVALAFKRKYDVKLEDIEECIYYVPKVAINLVVEPYEEKIKPQTPYGAKFSLPYTVVVALRRGWVGLWDFTDESIRNPEILNYTSRIKAVYDKGYDKYGGSEVIPAKARITLRNGRTYEEEVIEHKGTPKNPLTRDEVITKFMDNIKQSKYRDVGR
ncbi:MAG: MmgE/PrpD family protein, partial [Candidatus Methanomethylicia archaeon]